MDLSRVFRIFMVDLFVPLLNVSLAALLIAADCISKSAFRVYSMFFCTKAAMCEKGSFCGVSSSPNNEKRREERKRLMISDTSSRFLFVYILRISSRYV